MANALRTKLQSIVNAIARKKQLTGGFINAENIESEIESIEPIYDNIDITTNGEVDVTDYKKATVLVSDDYLTTLNQILSNSLTMYTIPYGVEKLAYYKFARGTHNSRGCALRVPTSVKAIEQVFFGWDNGNSIYYEGTIDEWIAIDKRRGPKSNDHAITSTYKKFTLYINDVAVSTNPANYTINTENKLNECATAYLHFNELTVPEDTTFITRAFAYITANKVIWNLDDFGSQFFTTNPNVELNTFAYSNIKELILNKPIATTGSTIFYETILDTCVFPEGLTEIGYQCFYYATCKYLEFPSTLISIAMNGLTLRNTDCVLVFNSVNPPTLASSSALPSQFIAYVPKGTSATWKSATNWSSKASMIFERNQVGIQVPSALLNNDQYTYSLDNGETWIQFDATTITLTEIANIKFKNTDANTTILIGTTSGGSQIGTIANAELNYNTVGDVTIYLTIQ